MSVTSADLLRELSGVTETFSHLGERLSDAALELSVSGIPPTRTMVDEFARSRTTFLELRERAIDLAGSLAASPPLTGQSIATLKDLETFLQALGETQERKSLDESIAPKALAILDRVLSLAHRDQDDFAPLQECQNRARELRAAVAQLSWPDLHPEATGLARRNHPFADLLILTEEETLGDDLWLQLKHTVSESFGRSLSLAAARGKLMVAENLNEEGHLIQEDQAPSKESTTGNGEPLNGEGSIDGAEEQSEKQDREIEPTTA